MLFRTHLVFGVLVWLIIKPYFSINQYLLLALLLFASLLPDIDMSKSKIGKQVKLVSFLIEKLFGHRKLFHSLLFWAVICMAIWLIFSKTYSAMLFIGIFSHLIIDALTKKGINFLYPVSNFRISGFIETGSILETVFLLVITGLVIAIYFSAR